MKKKFERTKPHVQAKPAKLSGRRPLVDAILFALRFQDCRA